MRPQFQWHQRWPRSGPVRLCTEQLQPRWPARYGSLGCFCWLSDLALGFLACGSWGCPADLSRGVDKDPCPQLSILLVWASLICFYREAFIGSLTEISCPFSSSCHQISDTHLLLKGRTLNFLSDGEHHIAFSHSLHRFFLAAYDTLSTSHPRCVKSPGSLTVLLMPLPSPKSFTVQYVFLALPPDPRFTLIS